MNQNKAHKRQVPGVNIFIAIYLLIIFALLFYLSIIQNLRTVSQWYKDDIVFFQCGYIGALGGTVYCTINLWRHASKRSPFYYVFRPIGGAVTGFISLLALKGGLLVLTSSTTDTQTAFYVYLLVAFVAGYKMVAFLEKIESVTLGKAEKDQAQTGQDSGSGHNDPEKNGPGKKSEGSTAPAPQGTQP